MATHHGREGVVKTGANTVAEVTDFSFETTMDTIEDTALTDTAKTFLAGRYEWSGEATCHWDETDTNGQNSLMTALTGGTTITLGLYPEGASSGDKYYSGTAYVTKVGISVPKDGTIQQTFSFKGTGALTVTN